MCKLLARHPKGVGELDTHSGVRLSLIELKQLKSHTNWTIIYQTETLDFVFWNRQLIGLALGLAAGLLQLEGMFVIIGFFVTMFLVSNMYAYKMLMVSDDDFSNNELMMEGIGNSAGIFFVSYVTSVAHRQLFVNGV